jgi:hypothetical protein
MSGAGAAPMRGGAGAGPIADARVRYEYLGNLPITVTGRISGRVYRFAGSGSSLWVEPRDAPDFAEAAEFRKASP